MDMRGCDGDMGSLVHTLWRSDAGNVWEVVGVDEETRLVCVYRLTDGERAWWHLSSLLATGMERMPVRHPDDLAEDIVILPG